MMGEVVKERYLGIARQLCAGAAGGCIRAGWEGVCLCVCVREEGEWVGLGRVGGGEESRRRMRGFMYLAIVRFVGEFFVLFGWARGFGGDC